VKFNPHVASRRVSLCPPDLYTVLPLEKRAKYRSIEMESKLKALTIYDLKGEVLKNYPHIQAHNTENGLLAFRFEQKPGDRSSVSKIIANLPFILEDDTV
jgi:hypothetical protein